MNPEKSQAKQLENFPLKVIERLEGHEEDIKREPSRLRKVESTEYQQDFCPEQKNQVQTILQQVIALSQYNTFNLIKPIFDKYFSAAKDGRIISLPKILEKEDIEDSDHKENGIMCVDMALKMKNYLYQMGINAYLICYTATGQINEAGNAYAGIGHISTVIPSISEGKRMFTIVDAGLLVPTPITFEDLYNSEFIYFRNKRCHVQYVPENTRFPYKFVIAEQVKNRKTGVIEKDEQGEHVYQVTDVAYFNPYYEILNPYAVIKDSMRALPGYRLATQDKEGNNKALVALDLKRKQIKLRCMFADGNQRQQKISFDDVSLLETDVQLSDFLKQTVRRLGVSEDYILQNLKIIIRNYDLYIDQFLAPSVRKEFRETLHYQKYLQEISVFLEKNGFSGKERGLLEMFFQKVLPSYARGKILFHEHEYPLRFSTLINLGDKKLRIPLMDKLDKTEKTRFGDGYPTLCISDSYSFAKVIQRFLRTVCEKKEKLFWLKSRDYYNDTDVLENVLTQVWFNANVYDFTNPEQFLERQICMLREQPFEDYADETNLAVLESMKNSRLVIQRVPQSGSNETPFMMNFELHSRDGAGRADLPSIRYAVEIDKTGEKIVYIYAIQKQKKLYNDEASQTLQKKINRQLFKLNKGVLDMESDKFKEYYKKRKEGKLKGDEKYPENISDVSPSAVFSLAAFIVLLKKEGIHKIKAPAFLPLRWQAHERLGKEQQERIQENMTNKFMRTFRRIMYHFSGVLILNYPKDSDGYLQIQLTEDESINNPILNEITRKV
jgi:hypothetical protein